MLCPTPRGESLLLVVFWLLEKSSEILCDYVGLGKIGRVLNPNILPAPTSNKHLSLPTGGIVSPTIRSKTGFANWHAFRVVGCVMRKIF